MNKRNRKHEGTGPNQHSISGWRPKMFKKLKWNNEPQARCFTAKFWTFDGVISMVYKSADHAEKIGSTRFLQ